MAHVSKPLALPERIRSSKAIWSLKKEVVIGVRVEGRVEIDEVDAGACHMLAQHLQVVAIIKLAGHLRPGICSFAQERRWGRVAVESTCSCFV